MNVNESRVIDSSQSNTNVLCHACGRGFNTNRGLLLHLIACQRKQQAQQNKQLETNDDQENTHRVQDMPCEPINESSHWNEKLATTFVNELNNADGKIVYWRKNSLLLPTGAAEKNFINEK